MIKRPNYGNSRRPSFSFAIRGCIILALLVVNLQSSIAQDRLSSGSSSKTLRAQAIQSIPFQQLNEQTRDKISDTLNRPSIYRRLPVTSINADPDYFRFLVRYPEVIVSIWQLMGVTQMTTERTAPYVVATNDGAGTISELELVYGTDNLHIFYGTGSYEGSVIRKKLSGKCVLVLRTESQMGADGDPVSTNQLDVFLKIENATASLVAKTISPLVGTTADHNFVESLKFVQRLNETTSKNGPGVQQMGQKLRIDTDVRQKFDEVVDAVFQRAINSAAPLDGRSSSRPAMMETQYTQPRQPPMNLDSRQYQAPNYQSPSAPPVRQGAAYGQLHDFGQDSPSPTRQTYQFHDGYVPNQYANQYPQFRGSNPVPTRQYNGPTQMNSLQRQYALPARGFQAPNYGSRVDRYQNPTAGNQPVQAGYDFNIYADGSQPNNDVQRAEWRSR